MSFARSISLFLLTNHDHDLQWRWTAGVSFSEIHDDSRTFL
jgi:hypothetical protein